MIAADEILELVVADPILGSLVEGLPFEACVCVVCQGDGCEDCGFTGVPLAVEHE